MRHPLFLAAAMALAFASSAPAHDGHHDPIGAAIAGTVRSDADRLRDKYRHPAETLAFFDVRPGQTVVEFLPGGGWYTKILAPLLKGKGRYIALVPDDPRAKEAIGVLLAGHREAFGETTVATLDFATGASTLTPGSADRILTFRNVHNLLMIAPGTAERTFAAFFAALKPGGVLGVVDHRLPETADSARERTSGYIKRSTVLALARTAGFELAGESEINANPKDTADWPDGVWTLPPTLKLGEKDRDRYLAIGESDRLTMKFVKPVP